MTGAGGFIGQHLIQELAETGLTLLAFDRYSGLDGGLRAPVELINVARPGALDGILDEETIVFHLAGSANVGRSISDPLYDFESNVSLTLNILESVRKARCRMLFPSSGSVYDASGSAPYSETSPLWPSSPYGAAKLAAEGYCAAYRRSYGLDVRVARIFSVYGPGIKRFAVYDFFQRLQRNSTELLLKGDGQQTRDYLYVKDVARALMYIMNNGEPGGVYNVGSGQPRIMSEVARSVARSCGLQECRIEVDGKPVKGELRHMEADVSRLAGLGFRGQTPFENGLRETEKWVVAQRERACL